MKKLIETSLNVPNFPPQALTINECNKLIMQITKMPLNKQIPILLALVCGLRVKEVVELMVKNFDLERSLLVLSTNSGHVRRIPIPAFLLRMITCYLNQMELTNSDYIFTSNKTGKVLTSKGFENIITVTALVAGITRKVTANILRRTAITNLFCYDEEYSTNPVKLAKLIGHNNADITVNSFVDKTVTQEKDSTIEKIYENWATILGF